MRLFLQRRRDPPIVDYFSMYRSFEERLLQEVRLFVLISLILIPLFGLLASLLAFIMCLVVDLILIYFFRYINSVINQFKEQSSLKKMLIDYIQSNDSLFDLDLGLSACFSFVKTANTLSIIALKTGDKFSETVENLEISLAAAVGRPVKDKKIFADHVVYIFELVAPVRLTMQDMDFTKKVDPNSAIPLGYGFMYDPAKTPHILIVGGTGSGKSVLISYFILEILKRSPSENLYIGDPKHADLSALSKFLPDGQVAHTPGNITSLINQVVKVMNDRYEFMNDEKNFIYGANYQQHGYEPVFLIVDELGAFSASGTDKSSKATIAEAMAGIKQIILLGRQAGVFVLLAAQQMNSNVLSTEMRDNLGLRIALGSNSREGYTMVFGPALPDAVPPVEVKGSGLLYQQGSGEQYAQYFESPFLDSSFDFITELKKLI